MQLRNFDVALYRSDTGSPKSDGGILGSFGPNELVAVRGRSGQPSRMCRQAKAGRVGWVYWLVAGTGFQNTRALTTRLWRLSERLGYLDREWKTRKAPERVSGKERLTTSALFTGTAAL